MEWMKIKCYSCGKTQKISMNAACGTPPRCPKCHKKMNRDAWNRLINAFFVFEDANACLRRHGEDGEPLFQAIFKTKYTRGKETKI